MPSRTAGAIGAVAVAASAGGLDAVGRVLGDLPADLPVPVLVVQHLDPRHESQLASILARRTSLSVTVVRGGEVLERGTVYIAPPDHHLVVDSDGRLALSQSPPVRFVRPSADRLFESLAARAGLRVLAVVLTGSGSDGADGVRAVRQAGGEVIAQSDARFPSMPDAAIATGCVELTVPLERIGAVIARLVRGEAPS